jgi:transcriptional regulator GlxA family with amidase domain
MQRHLDEPMPAHYLAARVNLSPSRFRTLFAAQTGVSPMRFLQRLRLRRARVLLERTFLSVKEVMALVGYNDPSHFARDFRREFAAAPSDLRAVGDPLPGSPSLKRPTYRRIGPPRARDPGVRVA